jgi:RNA polymerase sigma factor (sigma-70 family)
MAPRKKQNVQSTNNDFLTEIYNRYGKKLYSYAIRTWKVSEDDAWNLIYKTLYKVIETHQQYTFENEDKFASFVFRVFINLLRNHYRDKKNQGVDVQATDLNTAQFANGASATTEVAPSKQLTALSAALDEMEDWQRMLLLMRSEGMSYQEIAQYIDKPENQLKVYYQRLKEQLTKKLHEHI